MTAGGFSCAEKPQAGPAVQESLSEKELEFFIYPNLFEHSLTHETLDVTVCSTICSAAIFHKIKCRGLGAVHTSERITKKTGGY